METTIKQAEGQKVSISFVDDNSQCTVLLTPREFLFLIAQVIDYYKIQKVQWEEAEV